MSAIDSARPRLFSRLAKLSGSIVFFAISEAWFLLRKAAGWQSAPTIVTIYYHHVPLDQRDRFARQMDHLLRWAHPCAIELACAPTPKRERQVIVTADDAWLSFAQNALPELTRRNIPVTIFAVSNRLGSTVDGILIDRLVTADELCGLRSELVTIGSHTANHKRMTLLDEDEARYELVDSRQRLSDVAGSPVNLFCFPYGSYREDLIEMARASGYDRVFTTEPYLAEPGDFVVGRVRVDPTDWLLEFHLKLMGAYRWLPVAIALRRRLMARFRRASSLPAKANALPSGGASKLSLD